jgi:hypothetical protein
VHSAFFVGFESAMIMGDCQPFPNPGHFNVQDQSHTHTKFSLDNDETRSTEQTAQSLNLLITVTFFHHSKEKLMCIYKPPSNGGKTEDGLPCDFQPLLQAPPL